MSRKHKVMIVGAVGAGKSSLAACINNGTCFNNTQKEGGLESEVRKTQSMVYDAYTIDSPGEYMENPRMYKYIIAAAQNAEYVIFVQDSTQRRCIYPPGFAKSFNCRSIGVISKVDDGGCNLEKAMAGLRNLGIDGPIFATSAKTGKGITELNEYLFKNETQEGGKER